VQRSFCVRNADHIPLRAPFESHYKRKRPLTFKTSRKITKMYLLMWLQSLSLQEVGANLWAWWPLEVLGTGIRGMRKKEDKEAYTVRAINIFQ